MSDQRAHRDAAPGGGRQLPLERPDLAPENRDVDALAGTLDRTKHRLDAVVRFDDEFHALLGPDDDPA
jgi:hypothetical protein